MYFLFMKDGVNINTCIIFSKEETDGIVGSKILYFKIHAQSDSIALVGTCLIYGSTDILQL